MFQRIAIVALFQFFLLLGFSVAQTAAPSNDWKVVEQALGRSGQPQADGVYKFGLPRGDLKVTVDGLQVKPALALGSWLAFSGPGQGAMLTASCPLALSWGNRLRLATVISPLACMSCTNASASRRASSHPTSNDWQRREIKSSSDLGCSNAVHKSEPASLKL